MSRARFVSVLKSARLRENDRVWFARWLDAYGKSCGVGPNEPVPVDRDCLIAFLRQQKAKGRKAWPAWSIPRC